MKKVLLTMTMAAFSFAAFAQLPSIGIKAGVNFAGQSVSEDGMTQSSSTLTTFNAGVFVDFPFGQVSIQPALNFTGKGAKYTGDATDDNGNDLGNVTVTENLYYLQLPVNIVYHIPVVIGNVYFGAGPYVAEGLSGKVKLPSGVTGDSPESDNVHFGSGENDLKPTQIGGNVIAGFKFSNGFLININYDLSFTNDYHASAGISEKAHVFGVSVGYAF